jgi:hypothetical protein
VGVGAIWLHRLTRLDRRRDIRPPARRWRAHPPPGPNRVASLPGRTLRRCRVGVGRGPREDRRPTPNGRGSERACAAPIDLTAGHYRIDNVLFFADGYRSMTSCDVSPTPLVSSSRSRSSTSRLPPDVSNGAGRARARRDPSQRCVERRVRSPTAARMRRPAGFTGLATRRTARRQRRRTPADTLVRSVAMSRRGRECGSRRGRPRSSRQRPGRSPSHDATRHRPRSAQASPRSPLPRASTPATGSRHIGRRRTPRPRDPHRDPRRRAAVGAAPRPRKHNRSACTRPNGILRGGRPGPPASCLRGVARQSAAGPGHLPDDADPRSP